MPIILANQIGNRLPHCFDGTSMNHREGRKRRMKFAKWTVQGNDFVVVEESNWSIPPADEASLVAEICHRRTGVGADGLAVIAPRGSRIAMRFFNADGSVAGMCGNGAACVAVHVHRAGQAVSPGVVSTEIGAVDFAIAGESVELSFHPLALPEPIEEITLHDTETSAFLLKVGVQHLIVLMREIDWSGVEERGRLLRNHPAFAAVGGANVSFVAPRNDGTGDFDIATYEKGVERQTHSCGSGSVAGAICAKRLALTDGQCVVFRGVNGNIANKVQLGVDRAALTVVPRLIYVGQLDTLAFL